MTKEEGLQALARILDASVSDAAIRCRLHSELAALRGGRSPLSAKGFLAEVQRHCDLDVPEEIGILIKGVYFHFA